jgi:SAM-dependent methyltransferase
MTDNQRTYESTYAVQYYAALAELQPPERTILGMVLPQLKTWRVLDLGVGGGRTTVHFAEHAAEYVGVDYSAGMIDVCRERFAGKPWQFEVADARELPFDDASFNFVLFSYNGIDAVPPDDRKRVLGETHRVLAEGGLFAVSSHNLAHAPLLLSLGPTLSPRAILRHLWLRRANPPLREIKGRDWVVLRDRGLRGGVESYYVRREEQVRQLTEAGFAQVQVFQLDGDVARVGATDPWLYYLSVRE